MESRIRERIGATTATSIPANWIFLSIHQRVMLNIWKKNKIYPVDTRITISIVCNVAAFRTIAVRIYIRFNRLTFSPSNKQTGKIFCSPDHLRTNRKWKPKSIVNQTLKFRRIAANDLSFIWHSLRCISSSWVKQTWCCERICRIKNVALTRYWWLCWPSH